MSIIFSGIGGQLERRLKEAADAKPVKRELSEGGAVVVAVHRPAGFEIARAAKAGRG